MNQLQQTQTVDETGNRLEDLLINIILGLACRFKLALWDAQ